MAGLLKYAYKHTKKKDKLDTNTLPNPGGLLSKDIPSSYFGITNTHMCHVQQEASSEREGHIFC